LQGEPEGHDRLRVVQAHAEEVFQPRRTRIQRLPVQVEQSRGLGF
jgi:hypothetical protein